MHRTLTLKLKMIHWRLIGPWNWTMTKHTMNYNISTKKSKKIPSLIKNTQSWQNQKTRADKMAKIEHKMWELFRILEVVERFLNEQISSKLRNKNILETRDLENLATFTVFCTVQKMNLGLLWARIGPTLSWR